MENTTSHQTITTAKLKTAQLPLESWRYTDIQEFTASSPHRRRHGTSSAAIDDSTRHPLLAHHVPVIVDLSPFFLDSPLIHLLISHRPSRNLGFVVVDEVFGLGFGGRRGFLGGWWLGVCSFGADDGYWPQRRGGDLGEEI
ncbi:hypothetical protein LWI29_020103 [Acer saccharum]|uniref:Uncharacterized protein n=1 Tax=Acer saccharum TaxID=4024 RepID=A0AA39STA3_ACESA|nr:hypothetical protein LWI29_020103 [Acer saccharum]